MRYGQQLCRTVIYVYCSGCKESRRQQYASHACSGATHPNWLPELPVKTQQSLMIDSHVTGWLACIGLSESDSLVVAESRLLMLPDERVTSCKCWYCIASLRA